MFASLYEGKTLQTQLWEKDLPALRRIAPRPFSAALLKGRSNYVCLLKLSEISRQPQLLVPDEHSSMAALLERLVADVLEICSAHTSIRSAAVTIEKPHALRFADSVSLTLEYHAEQANNLRLLEKAS